MGSGRSPSVAGRGTAAPASPPGCRSPAPTARGAHDAGRAGRSPYRGRSSPNGRPVPAHAWSGGEVRRFLRRLFRRRRRQSWEEEVAAGGSPRSGRRLEAAHRVPARINDLRSRRSLAASRWPRSVGSPVLADRRVVASRGVGRWRRRSGDRSGARAAPAGGKGSSGPGRASAGRRLSRRSLGPRRQRRPEGSGCAFGDVRVSRRPWPLPRGGNSHAGRTGALAAGRLRFGFAAAAALLAERTRNT